MGASISSSHIPHEVELYRQAERALLEYYGLDDGLVERWVNFDVDDQKRLGGIARARVWELRPTRNKTTNATDKDAKVVPVVFVHGGGGTPLDFVPLLPYLAHNNNNNNHMNNQNKYHIICVERPGNGMSDPFDYRRCGMDLHHITTAFLHVLFQKLDLTAKQKVHLVGNSIGGFCLFFALQYPHQVASVTLAGVPAGFQGMRLPFYYTILNSWIGLLIFSYAPSLRLIPLLLLWLIFRIPLKNLPSVYIDNMWRAQAMRNNLLSFYSLIHQLSLYANSNSSTNSSSSSSSSIGWRLEDLHTISQQHHVPILVVDGPGDPFISKQQRKLLTLTLGSKRHLTIGKGHMPWFVEPHQFALALQDFWTESTSTSTVGVTTTTTTTNNTSAEAEQEQ